ncbi:hypothetical protein C8R44DRAFT_885475 [Mycena epipterygia]|nr:hypothetical protein C8R44DRAFT_885475 [Mycena epipterygia]
MFKWFIALCHIVDPPCMCSACSLLAVLLRQPTALAALGESGVGRGRFCGFEVFVSNSNSLSHPETQQSRYSYHCEEIMIGKAAMDRNGLWRISALNDPRASFSNGSNRQFLGDALVFN